MRAKDISWRRVNHGPITEPLIDYLEKLIDEQHELGRHLKVCVGTDSQKNGKGYKYATAIIIEMKVPLGLERGKMTYKGVGAKVIKGVFTERYIPTLKERMLKEVQLSIDVCYEILDLLELYGVDLEIHADVNPSEKEGSYVALAETTGWMRGVGLTFKVKPEAYAASHGADRWCNGGK